MPVDALTSAAMSAFFGLCVPATSQGKLEQTLPTDLMMPLTDAEKAEYAEAIKGDDRAFRIKSDAGFILMTIKAGFCRIITGEGDTEEAATMFDERTRKAGGTVELPRVENDYKQVNGMIWTDAHDAVALVFSAQQKGNTGFFASAFGVHKD